MKSTLFLLAKHVKLIMILYSTRKRSGRTCRISRLHQSAHITKSELQSIEFQSTQIKNSTPIDQNPEHQDKNELQTTFIQSTQIKKSSPNSRTKTTQKIHGRAPNNIIQRGQITNIKDSNDKIWSTRLKNQRSKQTKLIASSKQKQTRRDPEYPVRKIGAPNHCNPLYPSHFRLRQVAEIRRYRSRYYTRLAFKKA